MSVALKFALRELRGGIRGFRIFLACLALGVAVIAAVGSVSSAIEAGLRQDGRKLLGGDIDLRLTHIPATAEQLGWLGENTDRLSQVATLRAMAILSDGSDRRLVELKTVDDAYPLFGALALARGEALPGALQRRADGSWGAVIGSNLVERLKLDMGQRFRIGDITLEVTGVIDKEPDPSTRAFELGPRVILAREALAETGLVKPGSQIRYHYRLALGPDQPVNDFLDRLKDRFPKAGWRIRDVQNAAPNIQNFVDRVRVFLTLVGLTALLVGGVGIGNAVRAYLENRQRTIAILKCLGAPVATVRATYLSLLMGMGVLGVLIGLVIGAAGPMAAAPLLSGRLPIEVQVGVYPMPLMLAAVYGLLVTLAFSIWPLARAAVIPGGALFRDLTMPTQVRPGWKVLALMGGLALALAALAVLTADDRRLAVSFVAGTVGTLLAFRVAAWAVMRAARAAPRPKAVRLRMAIANLYRPGAPTGAVVVSLGLGLTVLSAVALTEANLSRHLQTTLRGETPGFYFIDIQPNQIEGFRELVGGFPGVSSSDDVPMLRGRISAMAGVPVDQITPPASEAWILRGDRGLTWSRKPPGEGSVIVEGDWWPADYQGETLVSLDVDVARGFKLNIGDTMTVNVLGREVTARIANLRQIDWTTLGINFVMIFSPGLLEKAPQNYISTAYLPPDREVALEKAVVEAFPNVSSIRVKEVLEGVAGIVANLGIAVRIVAGVAILTGVLVLAGVVVAGHRRRVYDSVVLKVLGATRADVMVALLLEYGLMGLVTAVLAGAVGAAASYGVVAVIMEADWALIPEAVFSTVLIALGATLFFGLLGTWTALGKKAVPLLRNQ